MADVGSVLLVRHGESEGNRERVFTRTPDVPLTPAGRAQALATAHVLRERFRPTLLVTSPYVRARQTAQIIAEVLSLPVDVEDDLQERSYGEYAGKPYATARPGYDPRAYWTWRPPGGESLEEVAARVGAVLDRIVSRAGGDDAVVVSHGGVMLALWRHVTGDWERPGRVVHNAGILEVRHSGGRYHDAVLLEAP